MGVEGVAWKFERKTGHPWRDVDSLALRSFIESHPESFLLSSQGISLAPSPSNPNIADSLGLNVVDPDESL